MRRIFGLAICAGALTIFAGAAQAAGTTQPATLVTFTTATLNTTVQSGDSVYFQYDTGTLNSSSPATPEVTVATGSSHSRPITNLTSGTTYRFRAVINGTASSQLTFTTDSLPTVSTGVADTVTTTSGRLTGAVDPNGDTTTYRFEWGTSSSLGKATPTTSAGSGTSSVPVAATIAGLTANKRYYYRVSATNSAGTVKGSTRSFVTSKTFSGLTIAVQPGYIRYGGSATISGRLSGTGAGGVTVSLEFQIFPYTDPFKPLKTTKTSSSGGYKLTATGILTSTRVRVVTQTSPPFTSLTRTLMSRPLVGMTMRKGRTRTVFRGTTLPAMPNGLVRVQRRSPRGKWITIKRGRLAAAGPERSRYRLSVRKRKGAYRVLVVPRDGGAHSSGHSRVRVVR